MSRRILILVTVALVALATTLALGAEAGDKDKKPKKPKPGASPTVTPTPVEVPPCADILGATPLYSFATDLGAGLLGVDVQTAAPTCADVDYVLYVLDDGLTATAGTSDTTGGNGLSRPSVNPEAPDATGFVTHVLPMEDDDSEICIYSESIRDGVVLDRAPDAECADLDGADPGGSPGRSYN